MSKTLTSNELDQLQDLIDTMWIRRKHIGDLAKIMGLEDFLKELAKILELKVGFKDIIDEVYKDD